MVIDKLVHEASDLIKMVAENQVYRFRGFSFYPDVRTFVRTSADIYRVHSKVVRKVKKKSQPVKIAVLNPKSEQEAHDGV